MKKKLKKIPVIFASDWHSQSASHLQQNENAFNQKNNTAYLYQATDICTIQSRIMIPYSNNFTIYQPIGDLASAKPALIELLKFLKENEWALCAYNIGNYHWVVFAALRTRDKTTFLYKDSKGKTNESLAKQIAEIDSSIGFVSNLKKEQHSGVDCGIFALENMRIMAKELSSNPESFIKGFEEFSGFCSLSTAKALRHGEFSQSYVLGKYQEMILEPLKLSQLQKLRDRHGSEAVEIAAKLQSKAGLDKDITVRALSATESPTNTVNTVAVEVITYENTDPENDNYHYGYRISFSKNLISKAKEIRQHVKSVFPVINDPEKEVITVSADKLPIRHNPKAAIKDYDVTFIKNTELFDELNISNNYSLQGEVHTILQRTFKVFLQSYFSQDKVINIINEYILEKPLKALDFSSFSGNRDLPIVSGLKKFGTYYPSDLMHGILAAHCTNETDYNTGLSKVKKGDSVVFSQDNELYRFLKSDKNENKFDLNEYTKDWIVIRVIDQVQTGYFGIIYCNDTAKHLVLSHKLTNFALALKKNLFTQAGMQADFDKVVKEMITKHQGDGYDATEEAVAIVKEQNSKYFSYSLSTTGHSLGSWLAQLSVFYAVRDFKYNLKGITFDGPGSREMIQQMMESAAGPSFSISDLDIVSYFSAPNIVNCANRHVGEAYRLYPDIPIKNHESLEAFMGFFGKKGLITTLSHDLRYILPYFDKETGRPIKYDRVIKWPSITHKSFGTDSSGTKSWSLGSLVGIGKNLLSGEISRVQFWTAYKYLDMDNQYTEKDGISGDKGKVSGFKLSCTGTYKVEKVNMQGRVVIDYIDRHLIKLMTKIAPVISKLSINRELKEALQLLIEKYEIQRDECSLEKSIIVVKEEYKGLLIATDLRDAMREVLNKHQASYQSLMNDVDTLGNKRPTNLELTNYLPQEQLEHFVGREEIFEKIDTLFTHNQRVVISGFAGSGKSSCVLEYGYRQIGQGNMVVRWVDANSKLKFDKAYRTLAEELGIDITGKDISKVIMFVNSKLTSFKKKLLLIFDNAEREDEITGEDDYLTKYLLNLPPKVKLLITSRDTGSTSSLQDEVIRLKPFNTAEGIKYVKEVLQDRISHVQAEVLIKALDLLPLRLKGAITSLKNQTTPKSTISKEKLEQFTKKYKASNNEINLLLTSIDKIEDHWKLLQYVVRLDPDFMDLEIIKELLSVDDSALKNAIDTLSRLSLIDIVQKNGVIGLKMHRVVQQDIKEYANKFAQKKLEPEGVISELLKTLNKLMPNITGVPGEDWQMADRMVVSIATALEQEKYGDLFIKGKLYGKLGEYNEYVTCDVQKQLAYYHKSLEVFKVLYSGNHPDIALSLHNVGKTYQQKGDTGEGLKYMEQALEMRQALYSGDHPDIAQSLSNVGIAYETMGNLEKGLKYQEQALEMRQALYPGNHPDVAKSLSNVGKTYGTMGNIEKGLKYQEQALIMLQAIYSGDHPDIAQSLSSVGLAYETMGNVKKSLNYHEQALKMRQALYPGNHPDVAVSLNNVGKTYETMRNVEKGFKYLEQALIMRQALYPDNHLYIAKSLNNVGIAYKIRGEKGLKYLEQALKIFQSLYPGNHPDTALSMYNMGVIYIFMKDREKGLKYQEEALKMRQTLYPGNHPDVAKSLYNVGKIYETMGNVEKALKYLEQALKMKQALYPGNHPDVARSLYNVGKIYGSRVSAEEGLKYLEQALKMKQALYPGDHPDTAKSLNNMGMTFKTIGDVEKSLIYLEQALIMRQSIYSGNHPDIAQSLYNVGTAYKTLGDQAKYIEYIKQAYVMKQKIFGKNHSQTRKLEKVLSCEVPEFVKNNESREIIKQVGTISNLTIKIKSKVQKKLLDKIVDLAEQGIWHKGLFSSHVMMKDSGVCGYVKKAKLNKKIGKWSKIKGATEITKMLCFEAICLGIMKSSKKDMICATKFVESDPTLTKRILYTHPEYFVDGSILRACVNDSVLVSKVLNNDLAGSRRKESEAGSAIKINHGKKTNEGKRKDQDYDEDNTEYPLYSFGYVSSKTLASSFSSISSFISSPSSSSGSPSSTVSKFALPVYLPDLSELRSHSFTQPFLAGTEAFENDGGAI